MGRQPASRLNDHRNDRRARADEGISVLSITLLDPPLAACQWSGRTGPDVCGPAPALLLATEDESAILFLGVAKADAVPNAGNGATAVAPPPCAVLRAIACTLCGLLRFGG